MRLEREPALLMKNILSMHICSVRHGTYSIDVDVKKVGCSRHAGRDITSTNELLDEVRAKGYAIHQAAGICFRSRHLITNERTIEVQGPQTSGEVEFVAAIHKGDVFISVGSDHNDRSLAELWTPMLGKISDTAKSKQMAPAVVAGEAWLYDDVKGHWDDIILKSYVTTPKRRVSYQEYQLADLLDLEYYLGRYSWLREDGSVLLGGSSRVLPSVPRDVYQGQSSLQNVTFPHDFHFEMCDPVLKRTIAHSYVVLSLEDPDSLSL